jgi:hypothetical protein
MDRNFLFVTVASIFAVLLAIYVPDYEGGRGLAYARKDIKADAKESSKQIDACKKKWGDYPCKAVYNTCSANAKSNAWKAACIQKQDACKKDQKCNWEPAPENSAD